MLRRHLVEKSPVSQVCEDAGIQPTQFYKWQQVFFARRPSTVPGGRYTDP
jgi:transposase-like protein